MLQSHVIEIDGVFVGAAVQNGTFYRFIAIDPRVEELDASVWPSLDDVRRLTRSLVRTGRLPAAPSSTPAN